MAEEILQGEIIEINEDGTCIIKSVIPNIARANTRKYKKVLISYTDGRTISAVQRKKVYALIGEIADYVGDDPETQKNIMKLDFIVNHLQAIERKMFSLSDVSMSIAREFINYLVDFIVKNDIPTAAPLINNCEDIGRYIVACIYNRKCAVCGKRADIHHCEGGRVGMGLDRNEVHHLGRMVLPLCRIHHNEAHQGEADFMDKWHLQPVALDEALCKKLKLKI